jgi:outer membrane protein assembly factor BamB
VYVRDGRAYVGGDAGGLQVVKLSDQTEIFDIPVITDGATNGVAVDYNYIYVCGDFNEYEVKALDKSDGSVIWNRTHHTQRPLSIDVQDGVVYSSSQDASVVATDANNGDRLWTHDLHTDFVNEVKESNGVVFSGDEAANLEAVDLTNDAIGPVAGDGPKMYWNGDWVGEV